MSPLRVDGHRHRDTLVGAIVKQSADEFQG
jgi:hypothetical protein